MFWQGGFTFYAGVVVPSGTAVLKNSARRQGFITQEVTRWLNLTGAIALGVLAVDLLFCHDVSRLRWWSRLTMWLVMVGCQVLLYWLHSQLSALLQPRGMSVLDPEGFYTLHRAYLWTHTVQWAAGLVFVGLMLGAWQQEGMKREK
jgi:hypothetical protein